MNRIDAFTARGQKAFIPYVTAGRPSVAETPAVMHTLVENGADIIELGFPFSDPTADGKTIQAASQSALDAGFRRDDYFEILRTFREKDTQTPVVAFGYYNPVFHMGIDKYAATLSEAGADAVLIVDLPLEQQAEALPILRANGLHLIQLIAPTTPPQRKRRILADAGGFVYQISLRGVMGARATVASDVQEMIAETKQATDLPVMLGFGISHPEQAAKVAAGADGVVVGSAIVKLIEENLEDCHGELAQFVREIAAAVHADGAG